MLSRYPFDWKTPSGYLGCISIQISATFTLSALFTYTILLTIAFCMVTISFVQEIEGNLRNLNRKLITTENEKLSVAKQIKIKRKFFEIIRFYLEIRELV